MTGIFPHQKEGSSEERRKKGARIEKQRGETSFEKLHVSKGEKKNRMRFTCC
jgi:hypothetical protein